MIRTLLASVALSALVLAGCSGEDPDSPEGTPEKSEPEEPRPETINGQPAVVTIKHVLIAFQGTTREARRTQAEAEALAFDVLGWANEGKDFDELVKEHSDDPGGGTYTMVNKGITKRDGEYDRSGMVKAFGDVGFAIRVDEIAIAMHDPQTSPFGYHIIKRVK